MKRSNGTGSIKYIKGRSKPYAVFRPSKMVNGKRKAELIGYFATHEEAEETLRLETLHPTKNTTLGELWNMWKKTRSYTDLAKSTQEGYNMAFNYMEDYHSKRFADMKQDDFQRCIDNAVNQGKSVSTQNKVKILCNILSVYALINDITYKSYAVKLKTAKAEKPQIEIFSADDIKKLFANDNKPLVDTILILIYTGMRISELLTLNKFQVNLNEMVIVGGLKTDAGRDRIIPVHPKIQNYISRHYESCKYKLIEHDGKPYTSRYYRKKYYEVLESLGIRKISPHKARHTFFSLMSLYCKDSKVIADVGGHTDVHFTENVYVHPDLERLRKGVECLP